MTEIKRKGENTEERMEMAYEGARGYFRQGLNCAECVLKAFMEVYDTGLPAESVAMATGFGAGLGHTKEGVCGAISGAVMAQSRGIVANEIAPNMPQSAGPSFSNPNPNAETDMFEN